MEKTKKEKEKEKEKNMNKNKNSRRKRAVVQDSSTNGSIFCTAITCSLVAWLAVLTVPEESASRGFMDMDMRGGGGGGGGGSGGSAVHLKGRELGDVNGSWFDSDLQTCLVDEKIWDQFEASGKLTGRRATYNKSLDTTSFDMSKVGV